MSKNYHIPVLLKETLEYLAPAAGKTIVDCTLGGGGHAERIIKALTPTPSPSLSAEVRRTKEEGRGEERSEGVRVITFDQDIEAINEAKEKLKDYNDIVYIHDNFSAIKEHVKEKVDGVLFDLGVSSYQIDTSERGFSLQKDGPLDMRMDKSHGTTARELIQELDQDELAQIIKEYGEDRFAKKIARNIKARGDVQTTQDLRKIVERSVPPGKFRLDSVTRVFQALRIAVNNELENLKKALGDSIDLLKPGGRIVVLSYHSLEDRIVKNFFKLESKDCICPTNLPKCVCGHFARLKILTKKPVTASSDEVRENPRARSAKLRAAEKL